MLLRSDRRATRKEPDGEGRSRRNSGGSVGAAGSLLQNPHATSDGQRQRPAFCFAEPCLSVTGMHPGKRTGEPSRFGTRSPEAVRSRGIRAVAVGTIGWVHLGFRIRLPVSAVAGPSDRARLRLTESAPILSLLNVKAATLLQASKSPIHTAPAGRPATPRLPGFVEVFHLAPAGRHADGVDFASVRCWGGLTLTTALREGSFFSSF